MSLPRIVVQAGEFKYDFVLDAGIKPGVDFQFGAFFSKSVLTDEVFRYPASQRIAVLTESPIDACYRRIDEVERRFSSIYTHQRGLLRRGPPFRALMFGTNWLGIRDEEASLALLQAPILKSGMVSFIGSLEHPDEGAYRFRREVAEYVVARGDVDCFGKGIRAVPGKREAIGPYRFSIAMENAASDDYFSEKLIDCLLLETIPVYFGCPGIGELFDPRGLLAFDTREALGDILDTLTAERYESMLPFAIENRRRAIAQRWHNHAGLFSRLAEGLPESLLRAPPVRFRSASRLRQVLRRWNVAD